MVDRRGDGHAGGVFRLAAHPQISATSAPLSEVVVPQVRWLQYPSVVAKTTSCSSHGMNDRHCPQGYKKEVLLNSGVHFLGWRVVQPFELRYVR